MTIGNIPQGKRVQRNANIKKLHFGLVIYSGNKDDYKEFSAHEPSINIDQISLF